MDAQLPLFPTGLTRTPRDRLMTCAHRAATLTVEELQAVARRHLDAAADAHQSNPCVNLRLATALCDTMERVTMVWETLTPHVRLWFAGAILHFASSDDDAPDFTSPIGFDDDAEVLNAGLRFAGYDDLCVHPEAYDDI
jgi:hypothetical protein